MRLNQPKVVVKTASKEVGHPKMWYQIRLLTLWFIVQNFVQLKNITIRNACKHIERMGGVFEYSNDDGVVWSMVASTQEQIRRLYYEGDKAFDEFERTIRSKHVPDYHDRPFKAQLRKLAGEMGKRKIIVLPILSSAIMYVLGLLRVEGICKNSEVEFPGTGREVDAEKVRFVPDGQGHWTLKGVSLTALHPVLDKEGWEAIVGHVRQVV
jgi:hypothetical protein